MPSFLFRLFHLTLAVLLLGVMSSCEEGELLENQPPETSIFLESIRLDGQDRLSTIVELFWSGEDVDGFVIGFDLSLDGNNWSRVTQTDSTFRFVIEQGQDTTDISFFIRAVDNLETVDPTPAFLSVPIKNTPPSVNLDESLNLLGEVLPVFSVRWTVEDLDGFETLDSVFIKLNEAPWISISPDINLITLRAEDPSQAGSQQAVIRTSFEGTAFDKTLPGLLVEGDNLFYVQARDISGSLSQVDTSEVFRVQRKSGNLLVIDSHRTNEVDNILFPNIRSAYGAFDYLDVDTQVPTFMEPTFRLVLEEYDQVFWYGDGTERSEYSERLFLDFAAPQIQQYLNQGGKIWMSSSFPSTYAVSETANSSLVFGYSPMDTLSTALGQARILRDISVPASTAAFPTLSTSAIISSADPFHPKNPADVLYEAEIRPVGGWVGPSAIAAKSVFSNGQTNQIFFSVELHQLSGDSVAFRALFDQVFQQEFNW
ncbi:MAG: hypothetical protein AAGC85_12600 [Bacteroidota bacterium]